MYRLVTAVALVAAVLVWPTMADAENTTIDAEQIPIVWVDLDGPDGLVSRGLAAEDVADHSHAPVGLVSVTVDDDGLRSLTPLPVTASAHNLNYPPDMKGVAASENGALTSSGSTKFPAALARSVTSDDLRHYVRHDDVDQPRDERDPDYDLRFSSPLPPSAYLVLVESSPDAVDRVQALGADGVPLSEAPVAVLAAGVGWDTGFASADRTDAESARLTVLDVDSLLEGTGADALHGLRVANHDDSDFKIIPMAAAGSVVETDTGAEPANATEDAAQPEPESVEPGVTLAVTAYAGEDDGANCPGSDRTRVTEGDSITYCFEVGNTGNVALDEVSVQQQELGPIVAPAGGDGPLPPGETRIYHIDTVAPPVADTGVVISATVEANPVDVDGADLAGLADLVAHGSTELLAVGGPNVMLPFQADPDATSGGAEGSGAADGEMVQMDHPGRSSHRSRRLRRSIRPTPEATTPPMPGPKNWPSPVGRPGWS